MRERYTQFACDMEKENKKDENIKVRGYELNLYLATKQLRQRYKIKNKKILSLNCKPSKQKDKQTIQGKER